ncbi:MAG: flagellar basal body P-ring protein FlgI, partial [Bacteroidetes bacterium]|nr:flagellar basal body P-ring protein FlgI [Bacteroidota bacterium]
MSRRVEESKSRGFLSFSDSPTPRLSDSSIRPHPHTPIPFAVFLLCLALLPVVAAHAQASGGTARLKDLVVLEGAAPLQLTGYGLVVGLDRTGDRARGKRGAPYTVQSITNMLRQFGITVDPAVLSSRNVAAVMATATMNPFSGVGSTFDVTVSSLGDARSLSGGILLQTPLLNPLTGQVHATAQGAVSTSAVLAASSGSSVKVNHSNTGRVPNGAIVAVALPSQLNEQQVGLVLRRPDFTNAVRIAEAINATFADAATVAHAGLVQVAVPAGSNGPVALMAALEGIEVAVDVPARVVINERTGTIVAGGNVRTQNYWGGFVTLDPVTELVFVNNQTAAAYNYESLTVTKDFSANPKGEADYALQFRWDMPQQSPTSTTVQNTAVTDE